jgi:hypothetical protein
MRTPYTTMIDRPGLYLTRDGRQVRIDSIVPGSSFPCKGRIARIDSIGRVRWIFDTWALNGQCKALPGSARDVVAYVSA